VPDSSARRAISVLRSSHDRLQSLVVPLEPDELERGSFASEWTIADVLSHLGSQAELLDPFLVAAREGKPEPDRAGFPEVWDRWNALSPTEQREQSAAAVERHVAHLESLSDDDLSDLEISLFDGAFVVDVAGYVQQLRLTEHAIHTWDVEVALDPSAVVPPAAVDLLVPKVPLIVGRAGRGSDRPFQARVDVTDRDECWDLTVGEAAAIAPCVDGQQAESTIGTSGEALLRLVFGRNRPEDDVRITGPLERDDLLAAFPGP